MSSLMQEQLPFDDLLALMETNDIDKARLLLFHLFSAFTPTPLHLAVREVSRIEPILRLFLEEDLRGVDFAEFIRGNAVVGTLDLDNHILVNDEDAAFTDLLFKKACYIPEYILLFPPSQRVIVKGRPLIVVETKLDTRMITAGRHYFHFRVVDTRGLEIRPSEGAQAVVNILRQKLVRQKGQLDQLTEVENPFEKPLLKAAESLKLHAVHTTLEYVLDSQRALAFMRGERQVTGQDVQDAFTLIRDSGLFGPNTKDHQRTAFEKLEQKLEAFAHTVNQTGATSCA